MVENPLEAVFAFVERAYVRLQAGEMLIHCLEQGSTAPMQNLVEELVLAGPTSLDTLREVQAEVSSRKAQLQDDLHQIYSSLEKNLRDYGVELAGQCSARSMAGLSWAGFLTLLRKQEVSEERAQAECYRMLRNAQELMEPLIENLRLMNEVELTLRDWLWGLFYQSAHLERPGAPVSAYHRGWML
jgi:hypothetical protein